MCRSRTEPMSERKVRPAATSMARLIAAALATAAVGTALGGCSEMYFDHREGVTSGAGDAVAANEAMQTIDPWPARSGNPNIATNGQRMQSAVERYRTNNVTQPVDTMQIESANLAPPTIQLTPPASAPMQSIGTGSSTTTTTVVSTPPAQASQ
jgi:hypothetical protein